MDEKALVGLGPDADAASHRAALEYFELLKASVDGWKICVNTLSTGQYQSDEYVRFFCFQVVEHYLKTGYSSASDSDRNMIKTLLLTWLQQQAGSQLNNKSFMRNKAAQMFSLVFLTDYPQRWQSFFTDLLGMLHLGEAAIDTYLRVLLAIDSEVVDRDISHSDQEIQRNTLLKDAIREYNVTQIVDSWYHIITTYEHSNAGLTCMCLNVIGAYVSWIDICLIANQQFVDILLKFMSNPLLRESTCDCIHNIIIKGMDPIEKVKLIESFMSVLQTAGVFNLGPDEDSDYLAKLANLINGIGLQLIAAWQKTTKQKDSVGARLSLASLDGKLVLLFRFLGDEDDDVSAAVAKFALDYVSLLKQVVPLTDNQKQMATDLLYLVIKKMKYDESYSFEQEGEDEAMFQDYRKELKVIFNNIGALDKNLILETVDCIMKQTLPNWQTTDFRDVEMSLTLLYMLAEAVPAVYSQYMSSDEKKNEILHGMLLQVMTSRVICQGHSAVTLQLFETVIRYDRFFGQEPTYIPDVLMALLDERGLRNPSPRVSSRTAYLFSRFIKNINKTHLQLYVEEVLKRLQDLLELRMPTDRYDQTSSMKLSNDDQQFVYETASILIVHSHFSPKRKQELMHQLIGPVMAKFEVLLQKLPDAVATEIPGEYTSGAPTQQDYALCISQAMTLVSRASKGFSNQNTMKLCNCVDVFMSILKVFLRALDSPVCRGALHSSVRQFLHRMVVCMEAEILPFIPIAMQYLLKAPDVRELYDFIPLLNQLICKFKTHIVPFMQEVFMGVVTTIFNVLSLPTADNDQNAVDDKRMLRRGYFMFLSTLVNNEVTQVLSNQESQNLQQVLVTVIQGAVDIPDPLAQKTCFGILKKLVELWGGQNGLTGFDEFITKSIVPACFLAPMKTTFDLKDAQTILVLHEASSCLKMASDKQGDQLTHYLQTTYLPSLNVTPNITQEFCLALKADGKEFKAYYKKFFNQAKT